MATRSMKEARRRTIERGAEPVGPIRPAGPTGPSPFPLLILALLIGAILLLRIRAEERGEVHPVAMQASVKG